MARAASMAIGAMMTAVAVLEMKSPMRAVTMKTTASMANGPSGPRVSTSPDEINWAAPDLFSAVARGRMLAISTTAGQLTLR